MVPEMQKGGRDAQGDTPKIGILTTGCEMEVGVEEREAPLWNICTNRRKCVFVTPLLVGGVGSTSEVLELRLGGYWTWGASMSCSTLSQMWDS